MLPLLLLAAAALKPLAPTADFDSEGESAVLIQYGPAKGKCELIVSPAAKPKDERSLTLDAKGAKGGGDLLRLFALPAGDYVLRRLECGGKRTAFAEGSLAGFTAFHGKVSYIGRAPLGGTFALRRPSAAELPALVNGLEAMDESFVFNLVSGYDGRPIDETLRDALAGDASATITPTHPEKVSVKDMSLAACQAAERRKNPLAIGSLTVRVTYKRRSLVGLQWREERHLWSHDYLGCIERTVRRHNPGTDESVSYDIVH